VLSFKWFRYNQSFKIYPVPLLYCWLVRCPMAMDTSPPFLLSDSLW